MPLMIEYQYFAPVILFKRLCSETHLLLEQYETYQKVSFRNRCIIAGANGRIVLSIPLVNGRNQKAFTRDIRVDNSNSWQGQHWKTITSCYNRSPWFEYYSDELNTLYRTPYAFLMDWNLACLGWAIKKLECNVSVSLTDAWRRESSVPGWEDWRNRLLPNSIEQQFPAPPRYRQVFEERTGFLPHLSILDLLFCEGKNAQLILKL